MLTLCLDLFAKGTPGIIGRIGATGRPGPKVQGPCQILFYDCSSHPIYLLLHRVVEVTVVAGGT